MAKIGFFFLLLPGEHTVFTQHGNTQLFRLCNVTFCIGATTTSASMGALELIPYANFVTLTFSKQKNGRENEIVGHACSGHAAVARNHWDWMLKMRLPVSSRRYNSGFYNVFCLLVEPTGFPFLLATWIKRISKTARWDTVLEYGKWGIP
jgi:hypothetical protein